MQVFRTEILKCSSEIDPSTSTDALMSKADRVLNRSNVHVMIQDVLFDLSEMGALSEHIH